MNNKIKGVLFDMDGVLVDSMPYHAKAWREVLLEEGIPLTLHDIYSREGMSGNDSVREFYQQYNKPDPEVAVLEEIRRRTLKKFESYSVSLFPGIDKLLKRLVDDGIKLGLVTGSSRFVVDKFIPADILELFSAFVTADKIARCKPFPDPYLKGAELLGLVSENIIAVENAPMGIKSAKSAGLFCIAITTTLDESFLKEADITVKTHQELISYIENLI